MPTMTATREDSLQCFSDPQIRPKDRDPLNGL